MEDKYLKETLIKLIVAVVAGILLIGGICVYMFWPEKTDEKIVNDDEIVLDVGNIEDLVENGEVDDE